LGRYRLPTDRFQPNLLRARRGNWFPVECAIHNVSHPVKPPICPMTPLSLWTERHRAGIFKSKFQLHNCFHNASTLEKGVGHPQSKLKIIKIADSPATEVNRSNIRCGEPRIPAVGGLIYRVRVWVDSRFLKNLQKTELSSHEWPVINAE